MCDFTLSQNLYSRLPHLLQIQDNFWFISYPLSLCSGPEYSPIKNTEKGEEKGGEKSKLEEEGKQN